MRQTRTPGDRGFTLLSSRLPSVARGSGVAFADLLCSFGAGGSCFAGVDGAAGFGSGALGSGASFCSGCVSGVGCLGPSLGASLASSAAGLSPEGAPPSSMRAKSWPTVTVSSSLTSNSLRTPASGAFTATSIYA
jgi:hypothetical protein